MRVKQNIFIYGVLPSNMSLDIACKAAMKALQPVASQYGIMLSPLKIRSELAKDIESAKKHIIDNSIPDGPCPLLVCSEVDCSLVFGIVLFDAIKITEAEDSEPVAAKRFFTPGYQTMEIKEVNLKYWDEPSLRVNDFLFVGQDIIVAIDALLAFGWYSESEHRQVMDKYRDYLETDDDN